DALREKEYPMLRDETYLDHTGTTLYAQSALTSFMNEMSSNLFGNPHSDSRSSRLSTERVDEIRKQTLEFFHADPEHFDLVFVMNATAAIKLVLEGLTHPPVSDGPEKTLKGPGLWVGYHLESHTSVVGLRELADAGQHCFMSDSEVEAWIRPRQTSKTFQVGMFAYPGQSNMTGRRLPLHWPGRLRQSEYASHQRVFTLLDAAALAPTASLDCFRDPDGAPDFTAVSFYKIFGFPDLGGLIVRKGSAQALVQRPYFGGGTVEMVTCSDHPWHSRSPSRIHEILEDGTVPFHSILALGCALKTHKQLYTSQEHVSHHTTRLTAHLYQLLSSLRHPNGVKLCEIYQDPAAEYGNSTTQGSIVAFNIRSDEGRWLRLSHVEEAANEHRIHLRTGSVCNPGGLTKLLQLDEWELFQNYTAGVRCGCRSVLVGHKPSGIIRVSLGAMSTLNDVEHFVGFVHHLFGAGAFPPLVPTLPSNSPTPKHLHVHTLMIYPIHGAAAYTIPAQQSWHLTSTGLQWDRQWCLVDLQTGSALDHRHAPRLLLLQPMIDAVHGILRISVHHSLRRRNPKLRQSMAVPLHDPGRDVQTPKGNLYQCQATSLNKLGGLGGGTSLLRLFHSPDLVAFFTAALGVPCTLARF
ncbi:PLP-dependent transferase, partial [Aspergillus japonicus CBS 114.51]